MKKTNSILWFRQDLRLSDNLALLNASNLGNVLPIYILDDCAPHTFKLGRASQIWLHHSLKKLNQSLHGNLNLYIGKADEIINNLIKQHHIQHVFCNTCYEPWHTTQENAVQSVCDQNSTNYKPFNSNHLWDINQILKNDNTYYKVFTAYKKKSYFFTPRSPIQNPKIIQTFRDSKNKTTIDDLNLIPQNHQWHQKIENSWNIGELAAQHKLTSFIENKLSGYKNGRDYPFKNQTSLLSPHLHFGEISPTQIWDSINNSSHLKTNDPDSEHFLSEVIWREFSYYLLYHTQSLHTENFNTKFDLFPWRTHLKHLKAWQSGQTGYPIIDAGMRELWQTGYMHNRVRMIVASFLVKNLNIHWHKGRDWFWDCLVDADLANNSASWQWVAGCGVDAAPYFRIFNPITQGEKFDKNGGYTRKFVPELEALPDKYLFQPWTAPQDVLDSSGVILGKTYPNPIIDLKTSRGKALDRYQNLKPLF